MTATRGVMYTRNKKGPQKPLVEITLSEEEARELWQDLCSLDPARENQSTKDLRTQLQQANARDH